MTLTMVRDVGQVRHVAQFQRLCAQEGCGNLRQDGILRAVDLDRAPRACCRRG